MRGSELPIAPRRERKESVEGDGQKRIYDYPVVLSARAPGPRTPVEIDIHRSQPSSQDIQETVNKETIMPFL